ncbi:MAG: glutamate 5-kinase [Burkholderiales bacterium]|nr:MAG: glutamate 5-kinase [Burkholderiales bacterium]TAG78500.1 MAG: glutamate 5-kinase [Betaproteobacteria bacterium]
MASFELLKSSKRIVAKVGSALVTNGGAGIDRSAIARWARDVAALRESGVEVIFVSSGAIAEGIARLGWKERPKLMPELQAAAAVGQMGLANVYEQAFAAHGLKTAQVLLTHEDLADRKRYLNARSTLLALLNHNVVPIINENDTVTTDEIKFGDNDTLGALVANLCDAQTLVLLTDQRGLYTADPRKDAHAQFISVGRADDPQYESMAGGTGTGISKGGMLTKILAARRAAASGIHTVIASGHEHSVLQRLLTGESIGTLLHAPETSLAKRKSWMRDHLQLRGKVTLDAGAARALTQGGRSLLPIGVVAVSGEFERGEVIACIDESGKELARGLTNYSSSEAQRIMRKPSADIEAVLGYYNYDELIHRDNLVLTSA